MEYNPNTQSYSHKNAPSKNDGKRVATLVIAGVIVIALIIFFSAFSPFVTIETGHTGVVTMFGKVEDFYYGEGFHIKNPLARVISIDNRAQKDTLALQAFSSDIQQVNVNATVNYMIPRDSSRGLYQSVGLGYYETIMRPRIMECAKAVFARYSAEMLVGARETLASQITELLSPEMEEYGIDVISVSVEDIDFTDAFTDAVEAKQVAEQTKLKTEIEQKQLLVVAQTDAERKIIAANADASVQQIQADAEAYAVKVKAEASAGANEKIAASLTKDLIYYKLAESWSGELPAYMGTGDAAAIFDISAIAGGAD